MQQLLLELAPPRALTFESYFPGRNAAAVEALRDALAGGERVIYLWGDAGSGKSHLLQAAAGAARSAGRSTLYLGARNPWPAPIPECSLLAVDDADRLDAAAQLALFNAYNDARSRAGCIVAAGTCSVADLPAREDLRTRLGSGVSLRLLPLSDAEKSVALAAHASGRGISLGEDMLRYLLSHCRRDMGTQIALLDALDRYSLEQQRPFTLPLLREALRQLDL